MGRKGKSQVDSRITRTREEQSRELQQYQEAQAQLQQKREQL